MTLRWLTRLALGLTLFLALAVLAIPSLRYKAVGVVRGEPFYRGLPYRYWIDTVRQGDSETRRTLFHAVPRNDKAAVPLLEELLRDESGDLRKGAAEGLGRVGPAAAPAVRGLCVAAAQDADERVRVEADRALDHIGGPGVAELGDVLTSAPDSVQAFAAHKLGQLGPVARPVVPSLFAALQHPNSTVWLEASAALDRIGLDAAAAPVLRRILEDETSDLRFWAAETLIGLDPTAADPAIPIVVPHLRPNDALHDRAVAALRKLGAPAVPALLRAAQDADAHLRAGAVETLGGMDAPEVAATLFGALKDANAEVRQQAVYALERSGRAIIPAERTALRDADDSVRLTALELLGKLGRAAQSETAVVRAALQDPSDGVRKAAAATLGQINPEELPLVVDEWTKALRQGSPSQRIQAANTLALFGAQAKSAIPTLIATLKDPEPSVRAAAADALGAIGGAAPEVVTALGTGLTDQDVVVRRRIVGALRKGVDALAPGPAVPALVTVLGKALHDPAPDVRRLAAEALQEVVYQVPDDAARRLVIPALAAALADKDDQVRARVAEALAPALAKVTADDKVLVLVLFNSLKQKTGLRSELLAAVVQILRGVGATDQALVPDLVAFLKEEAPTAGERIPIVQALAKIGPGAKAAVPVLMDTLRRFPIRDRRPVPGSVDEDGVLLRLSVLYTLGAIGPAAEPAVPLLIEALEAEEPRRAVGPSEEGSAPAKWVPVGIRPTAAYALGRIGPTAKAAIPALTKAAQGDDKELRTAAGAALKQVQGKP